MAYCLFSRVFTCLLECSLNMVRTLFEYCSEKDADLFPKRVRPLSKKGAPFSNRDAILSERKHQSLDCTNSANGLPFVVKTKAQQLVDLQMAVEIFILGHTIIIAHLQRDVCREEAAPRKHEAVFPFAFNTMITGVVFEA